jgi:hypothetical protein
MKNKGKHIISSLLDKCTSQLLGFWTLYVIRNYKYKKTQRFGKWIWFRPHVGGGEDTYSVGSLRKS